MTLPDGTTVGLDFLAQIRLADLPTVSQRRLLPARGTLFFFAAALSTRSLASLGPEAVRVLYSPAEPDRWPRRAPPADAGWSQNDLVTLPTAAQTFRDPEAPRSELFPQCPILPISSRLRDGRLDRPAAPATAFVDDKGHGTRPQPVRVADAVLQLHGARNAFGEGLMPLRQLPATEPGVRPTEAGLRERMQPAYEAWRRDAVALSRSLARLSGATPLTEAQRRDVQAVLHGAQALGVRLGRSRHDFGLTLQADRISLHELILAHPDFAEANPDEVAAAHPAQPAMIQQPHVMLGPWLEFTSGMLSGDEPLLLLQLMSDPCGPRFMWWDWGFLTFWIDRRDALAGRFENARAEIMQFH